MATTNDGDRSSGIELAIPRLLLDDGTIVARLPRMAGRVVIGRCPPADICLADDPHVSAVHACITWVPGFAAHVLHDCGSTNGTFIDGAPVHRPTRLVTGARIRVGQTHLVYCRVAAYPDIVHWSQRDLRMELLPAE